MVAEIYIGRHERFEAAEAYVDKLTPEQVAYLKDNEGDFWLKISAEGSRLLLIEDEG